MIQKQRLIDLFIELVKIDSPSGCEKEIATFISHQLKALDAVVEFDHSGNIIAKINGKGKPLLLNAHVDTVEPGRGVKPIIEHGIIKSDGTTVLGADPKAGVAVILETLRSLKEDKKVTVPLEIVFTVSEEMFLQGSINLNYEKISSTQGLVFDGEADVCNVDISAPGCQRIDATIIGRGAHAGVEPEKGISAIYIAAMIICKLPQGRIDDETTANIGIIQGGTARNAVPETVQILGEIRSRSVNKLDALTKKFDDIFAQMMSYYPEAKLRKTTQRAFNPYSLEKNSSLVQKIADVMKTSTGKDAHLNASGGGTDSNIFFTRGIQCPVIGVGAHNLHTVREYVDIEQMFQSAIFAESFISSLS